jgi:hypothetical protein
MAKGWPKDANGRTIARSNANARRKTMASKKGSKKLKKGKKVQPTKTLTTYNVGTGVAN